jgi:hypothetical protein
VAESVNNHGAFVWSIAELLRGDYRQSDYQKVILPLVVIRRFDAVLEPTKQQVIEQHDKYKDKVDNLDLILQRASGQQFYNTSPLTFRKLLDDPAMIADNLRAYIAAFSPSARDIIDKFKFDTQISDLDTADLLYQVLSKFADLDLHPDAVSNEEMGYLYEELIRKFNELSNETAGEHFTATITQAVTKGLDPTVPMKASNIPWIGEIPEHWNVTSDKRVSAVQYGLGQPPPESEDGIPIIRATNIDRGNISEDDLMRADLENLPLDRAPLLEAGEILVVRSGALTGDSAIITTRWVGSAPGYDLRLTPQTISVEYLAWFLLSTSGLEQMWLESSRAAQPHLNADELGGISVPYPPSEAQVAIGKFINGYMSTSQRLTNTLETQLALLAEYREALITAAVTGEIDVDTFDTDRHLERTTA